MYLPDSGVASLVVEDVLNGGWSTGQRAGLHALTQVVQEGHQVLTHTTHERDETQLYSSGARATFVHVFQRKSSGCTLRDRRFKALNSPLDAFSPAPTAERRKPWARPSRLPLAHGTRSPAPAPPQI